MYNVERDIVCSSYTAKLTIIGQFYLRMFVSCEQIHHRFFYF